MSARTTSRSHILIVEDRQSLRRMLERALSGEGYQVTTAEDGPRGIARVRGEHRFDLVLTDLKLPGASGLEVLSAARAVDPSVPVVVLTGYGTVATAVEAMKRGARDFLEKPVEIEDLFALVSEFLRPGEDEEIALEVPGTSPIVGRHPLLRAALRLLKRVAPKESTVLLTGESGTGKELFARALHAHSARKEGTFVAVNCAAIPESLMENELFGHEKGAFTGADRRQPGRFELARGGTLFLDEIGELSLSMQGKVLRVLEERTFERVGGGRSLEADVRLVAATNRDLSAMVKSGLFRPDLYFRLAVFPLELPPLRERASDIPALTRHLLQGLADRHGTEPLQPTREALDLLTARPWPGNVRELANVLERATILAEGTRLDAADLEPLLAPLAGSEGEGLDEREALRRALVQAEGDKHRAAEILGISYRTLQRRVKAHDLEGVPRYRS
jgi:two-component system response regulator AtoC